MIEAALIRQMELAQRTRLTVDAIETLKRAMREGRLMWPPRWSGKTLIQRDMALRGWYVYGSRPMPELLKFISDA